MVERFYQSPLQDNREVFLFDNFLNFFELSKIETEKLKNRIKKSNGLVRIFVHPYFEIFRGSQDDKKRSYIDQGIKKILQHPEAPPIFIMEEDSEIESLYQRLAKHLGTEVYVIATDQSSPTPRSAAGYEVERWKKLKIFFQELGIKKILLGGIIFSVQKAVQADKKMLTGCVNGVLARLSSSFEIEISSLVAPSSRTEFRNAQQDGSLDVM